MCNSIFIFFIFFNYNFSEFSLLRKDILEFLIHFSFQLISLVESFEIAHNEPYTSFFAFVDVLLFCHCFGCSAGQK